jgi:thioester reductase-like protein
MNQSRGVLLTGATGALGPSLAAELLAGDPARILSVLIRSSANEPIETRFNEWLAAVGQTMSETKRKPSGNWRQRVRLVPGDVACDNLGLFPQAVDELIQTTDCIVHAAADTGFMSSLDDQWNINVQGTRRAAELARRCKNLSRFILVSTVCTSGKRIGRIFEKPLANAPGFVNNYERTKWEAEQIAMAADLPLGIARVSIVVGSHATGAVQRLGGFHSLMKWFSRDYVPVIPGTNQTLVDLISSELVAEFIAKTLTTDWKPGSIWHIAAGDQAARLIELSEIGWREMKPGLLMQNREQPGESFIVDQDTFDQMRMSKTSPRQRVLRQAMDAINSFLPMLLYPRTYDVTSAEKLWGGPLPWPDWRATLVKMLHACGFTPAQEQGGSGEEISTQPQHLRRAS